MALAELVEHEREAAVALDLPRLLGVSREREMLTARWERLARERSAAETTTAADDEELRALQRLAADLSAAQRVNAGLVEAVLKQISGLLGLLEQERSGGFYDESAALRALAVPASTASWSA